MRSEISEIWQLPGSNDQLMVDSIAIALSDSIFDYLVTDVIYTSFQANKFSRQLDLRVPNFRR